MLRNVPPEWLVTVPTIRLDRGGQVRGTQVLVVSAPDADTALAAAARAAMGADLVRHRRHADVDLSGMTVEPAGSAWPYDEPRLRQGTSWPAPLPVVRSDAPSR